MNDCNFILCLFFYTQGSALSRQSLLYEYMFGACASSLEYLQCTMKICGCPWHMFASVQWLNSLWRRNSSSAVTFMCVTFVTCNRDVCEEHTECAKTWYTLQIPWLTLWQMMRASTKKWSDSLEWHVILSPNKKAGTVLLANRVMEVCRLHIGSFLG
jgi:hypothetical protein